MTMAKPSTQQVSSEVLETVADYFKVLSEVSRLQVLSQLRAGAMTVNELAAATGLGQANLSKHLKVLTQAGLLSRTPRGVSAYYEIIDPLVFALCESVCDSISERLQQQAQKFDDFKSFRNGAGI